jgi:uncharacterized protein YcgI (DUF1989 family)
VSAHLGHRGLIRGTVLKQCLQSLVVGLMARQKTATSSQKISIPARHAKAAFVKKGRRIKVISGRLLGTEPR